MASKWEREREVLTGDQARDIFKLVRNTTATNVDRQAEGRISSVFTVESPGERVIIKGVRSGNHDHDAYREYGALKRAQESGLKAPEPVGVGTIEGPDGVQVDYVVMG